MGVDYESEPLSASRTTVTDKLPLDSTKNPGRRQALMTLADAARLDQIHSSPRNEHDLLHDLPEDVLCDFPSSPHMRSVSTQTETICLSSDISAPVKRSVAIQTPDFCLGGPDYRLRKCTWPEV
jgi:hypothetical protein